MRNSELKKIELYNLEQHHASMIWKIGYYKQHPKWAKYNAPYFEEYVCYDSLNTFVQSDDWKFLTSSKCKGIFVNHRPIGIVTRYWIDEKTRWLEIGIIIFDETLWKQRIGFMALSDWITQTFLVFKEIEHIGLTTWSGNLGMMKLCENLGLKKEGCIRKVRYWNSVYYDSVKYGVLRSEWND